MNFETNTQKKEAYKFHEVTSLTSVKPYVLRFWETEFQSIAPEVLEDGSKLYAESDIEIINKVKDLLFNQKMSIPEAKLVIDNDYAKSDLSVKSSNLKQALEMIIDNYADNCSDVADDSTMDKPNTDTSCSSSVLQTTKRKIIQTSQNTQLSDKDIVSLVTAKKKLTGILHKIDTLSSDKGWS